MTSEPSAPPFCLKKACPITVILSSALLCLLCSPIYAQRLAFPGAEGAGRFASGGRGGTVYEVTNLQDSGPGSLRDAVSKPDRTIVFRISGIIHLKSTLRIKSDNLTIAGETAPGDGICIAGYTVSIRASNLIIRYLRCRLGDENDDADDAMNSTSHNKPHDFFHDIIIDHCSLSWAVDEVGSFYGVRNFTLQWCILAQSLYHSVHPKGDHGYGGIWGGFHASFHHNLIADNTSRNPRFGGSRYTGQPDSEIVDFRNNVIYNWGNINSVYGGEEGNYNMVNNYYKPGPATPGNPSKSSAKNKRNRILYYTSYYYAKDAAKYPDTVWGGRFFIHGNFVEGYPDVTRDNWTLGVQPDGYYRAKQLIREARQDTPFPFAPVTTQSAREAYLRVLDSAGAILPRRDAIDRLVVREARTGKALFEGATYGKVSAKGITHPSGIIDSQTDVGGYPEYRSAPALPDTDHDGMADRWEKEKGLNPDDAADGNLFTLSPDYTNLEVYLHGISPASSENPPTSSQSVSTDSVRVAHKPDLIVAADGSGDYRSVQAAIDAAPTGATKPFVIYIKPGRYTERLTIPADRPFIHLVGASASGTIISWNDYSGKVNPLGGVFGTSTSATVTVEASDFVAENLTIENSTGYGGDGPQAVALNVKADRSAFRRCQFISGQDTLLTWGKGNRQYFRDCYIDGNTDFIFGNAIAVFDSCNIYPRDRLDGQSGGYITAANTPAGQTYGYVFRNCTILENHGITHYTLGRPWQNDRTTRHGARAHNKVVFLHTTMGSSIRPEGWSVWNEGTNTDLITYAEYGSLRFDGSPVDVSKRVAWSRQLTAAEAARYQDNTRIFGSWDPETNFEVLGTPETSEFPELALANLRVKRSSAREIQVSWNLCWPLPEVTYEVFRSSDRVHFKKIRKVHPSSDSLVALGIKDVLPRRRRAAVYYYHVTASKAGLPVSSTDTVRISLARRGPEVSPLLRPDTILDRTPGTSSNQSPTIPTVLCVQILTSETPFACLLDSTYTSVPRFC